MASIPSDFLQQQCVAIAEALEALVTSRNKKRIAARVLRTMAIERPHCGFCGRRA